MIRSVATVPDLIAAMDEANSNPTVPYTINMKFGTYILDEKDNDTEGPNGLPAVKGNITINGNGSTIKRNPSAFSFRIFFVGKIGTDIGSLNLKGLTISGGHLDDFWLAGGAVLNREGNLRITQCTVSGNFTRQNNGGYGAGICNYSPDGNPSMLIVDQSIITQNLGVQGSGIYNGGNGCSAAIKNSTISNNVCDATNGAGGGGFYNVGSGKLIIDNCIISGNMANGNMTGIGEGGGINIAEGTVVVTNSVLTGNGGRLGRSVFNNSNNSQVTLNYNRIYGQPGGLGSGSVNNNATNRIDARNNWWGAPNGPSGDGYTGSGDIVVGNVDTAPFIPADDCPQEGIPSCPLNSNAADATTTNNPISLRLGEKRVEAMDLSVMTPAGDLSFKRTYRQGKQLEYQFMGLGWTHNHAYDLTVPGTSPNRTATLRLPDGGNLQFEEDQRYPGHFIAKAGSTSTMDEDTTNNEYVILAQDKSKYVFDRTTLKLKNRSWPNGESWTYTYVSSRLSEVIDSAYDLDPGAPVFNRKLQFSYIANPGQYNDGQLWRVGDHSATGLSSGSPTGRYIEFGYTPEKNNGVPIGSPKALLASVKDARANTWTYDYYGQTGGETTTLLLNRMTKRLSPSVDTTGDGTADGTLTLEKLTYLSNMQLDLAINGGMEVDSDWASIPTDLPTTNERSSVQKDTGNYSRHVVANATSQGIEGNLWNLMAGKTYTITARVYPVSNVVQMKVLGTASFNRNSSGTGAWQTLTATHTTATTVYNCRLQFLAGNSGTTEFYVDNVTIVETNPDYAGITQERGGVGVAALQTSTLVVAPHQNVSQETLVNLPTLHRFDQGVYLGQRDPAGNFAQQVSTNKFRPSTQVDAKGNRTGLSWDAAGKNLLQVVDAAGVQTTFGYKTDDTLNQSVDAEGHKTVYAYEDANVPRQPTLVLITNGSDLAINGDMEADSDWTNVGTPSSNKRIPAADSGLYTRHVVASAANQGIQGTAWNLATGYTYIVSARVYIVSGAVKMQVTGTTAFDQTSSLTGDWTTFKIAHIPVSGLTGNQLQFVASGGAAEFYVDSVSISKIQIGSPTVELAVDGGMELSSGSNWTNVSTPSANERTVGADSGQYARRIVAAAANQGIQGNTWDLVANRAYVILARVYTVSGTVRMKVNGAPVGAFDKTTSGTGKWQTLRAVYKPTGAVTGVRVQFLADSAAAEYYVDAVAILDNTMLLRWQEFTYDAKGRTLTDKTIDPADGLTVQQQVTCVYHSSGSGNGLLNTLTQKDIGGASDVITTYNYDSFGRVVKTQQSSNFGNCDISYTVFDAAGSAVAAICNYDPGVSPDPTTAAQAVALYNPSFPDKNRVTTHEYDALSRRVKATVNAGAAFAQTTLTVYDAMDRVIRTISNYVVDAGVPNPYTALRSAFNHGTTNNQNLVVDIFYNARGMVRKQIDVLDTVTLFGYDDAGRLVKTIQSAAQASYNNDYSGVSPDPTLGSYAANGVVDQDVVTNQAYDAAGNLVKTVDALGLVNYTVYDVLNRPVKTVRTAKDTATIALNPGDVGYNAVNDPRSDSYVISTSPDRDLIETTEYDALGRIIRSKRLLDNRPTEQWDTTLYGYDTLGRQVKVIRSASLPAYDIANDPSLLSYSANSNADVDIITRTAYDAKGRVMYTEDALGACTWVAYDGLGRQVKTITNAVGTATDGGVNDPRSGSYVPSGNPDKDLVTTTTYDASGRVQSTQDALNRVSRNVYDIQGRVIRVITNYVQQGATDPKDWVWSSSNNRWEYGTSNTTPISHGTDNDQNIITDTVYDAQGRVSQTFDNRHNTTLYLYDVLGRRVKTVVNYVVQGATNPVNWVWDTGDNRWEDGAGTAISFGTDKDQNRITITIYDLAGRVTSTRDAAGIETRFTYDALGRRTQSIVNYVNGVYTSAVPDEDLISVTTYNKGSQVVTTTDARGTQTAFVYDKAGRRLKVTQAANSPLATVSYTCYDKAGRVPRTIQNWIDNGISPDAKTGSIWDFVPEHNGAYGDRNLITQFAYDLASRRTTVTDSLGNLNQTAYFKDGQVQSMIDPENVVSQYRYDGLRRRTRVVQGYVLQGGSDPKDWMWDATDVRWEYPPSIAIAHGTNNDQNIIVDVIYDKAGRVLSLREPRGNVTSYAYDALNRRKSLTNPLSKIWSTAYADLTGGGSRVTMTYPGITGSANYPVQRDFDRLGRPLSVVYNAPSITPDVKFTYDNVGNRAKMSEYSGAGFTSRIRETSFAYDDVHRLTSAGFDADGNGTVDETVAYEYDAGGLRTKMTLPGSLNVVYTYNAKGQLVSLTDWDSQKTEFAYDMASRHIATERANGLRSRYEHDAAGRLKRLRHTKDFRTLAHFEYEVDKRGNRLQALEALANLTTTTDTIIAYNDKGLALADTWSDVSTFKESSQPSASLKLLFLGDEATLTMGTGPDHSIYDVYVGGSLWQSFDGYAASAGQRDIVITLGVDNRKLQGEGPHLIEIRNRAEKNTTSTGYKLRFKQLLVVDRTWTLQTVKYSYDKLSRLLEARYAPGANAAAVDADLLQRYLFTHDRAGNRLSQSVALNGAGPTVTNYTYNAANQLSSGGVTYDNNGNMTSDGSNSYTWDRANRLLSMGIASYKYDGLNNRVQQTEGANVTKYLLDLQPGLATVLTQQTTSATHRYIHGPDGIHARKGNGGWHWPLLDGLGSVRRELNGPLVLDSIQDYAPYGKNTTGVIADSAPAFYSFTGELRDSNTLLYLRARYYNPALGVFTALDPLEGSYNSSSSLNGYSWVEGNPINNIDRSGMVCTSWRDSQPSGEQDNWYRYQTCSSLENKLYTTIGTPISWNELFECYSCVMAEVPGWENKNVESYRQGLRQAIIDEMNGATQDRINQLVYQYEQSYILPQDQLQLQGSIITTLGGNGYIEGWSLMGGAALNGQVGREIVYNFATFQRAEFGYGGGGVIVPGAPPSGSLSHYTGYVAGFVPISQCSPKQFDKFYSQYEGEFTVVPGGAAFGLGIGVAHFYSSHDNGLVDKIENPVRGQLSYISGGLQSGPAGGALIINYKSTYFNEKSYIIRNGPRSGKVDYELLMADIRGGDGSPIGPSGWGLLWGPIYHLYLKLAREDAAKAAHDLAITYNNSSSSRPCGC